MTTIPSTAVVVYDPDLVDPEHVALAGFLGGYRGLTRDAYALDLRQFVAFCDRAPPRSVRGPPKRHRDLRTGARSSRSGDGHHRPTAVHRDRLLPLRRRGRPDRPFAGGPCPPPTDRLRVPCHRPGPQRGRSAPRRRWARPGRRACADLPAGAQRAAGLRSDRRRHRGPRRRARTSDAHHRAQGRQDRHHPARAAHRPRRRPGRRRTGQRPDLHRRRTASASTVTAPAGSSGVSPAGPGSPSRSARIPCATHSLPLPSMRGCRCATSKRPRRTPTPARPCATTGRESPSTVTPPTSCPPTSPERPADQAFWAPADTAGAQGQCPRPLIPPTRARRRRD